MVRPVETRDGSITGAPPVTSMVVETAPTFNCPSITAFRSRVQDDSRAALRLETFLLNGHRVCADRQVGNDKVAVVVRLGVAGESRGDIDHGDARGGNGRAGRIGNAPANTAIDRLRLREAKCDCHHKTAEQHTTKHVAQLPYSTPLTVISERSYNFLNP